MTMPPRGPARETPAVAPAPGYPVPAPRGTGMRGAVVGAVVGGVLALGVVVFLSATIAWWSLGQAWIGLAFAVVAVTTGVIAGRRRFV